MFCYQFSTATKNLMDPPMIDSTLERIITDKDMPLIIVCATKQLNIDYSYDNNNRVFEEFGYSTLEDLIKGRAFYDDPLSLSWGGHLNLTFDELKSMVFDSNKVDMIESFQKEAGYILNNDTAFIPGYGLCKEILNFDISKELDLITMNPNEARVFITEKNYRSLFMPAISTHVGSKLKIHFSRVQYIDVNIQVRTSCNKDKMPMTRDNYEKCVDDEIKKEFQQHNISCVPPWLSGNKQCNEIYSYDQFNNDRFDFNNDYVKKVMALDNIKHEINCRYSCRETTYVVNEREIEEDAFGGVAHVNFNQKVEVKQRLPNYDMFKYIIDVGSSLGLWLGLSILGPYDLVEMAVQFINKNFIIKKIRSAVSK